MDFDKETEKKVADAALDVTTVMREASLALRSFQEMSQLLENKSLNQNQEVVSILELSNKLATKLNQKLNQTASVETEIKKSIDSIQSCFNKLTQTEGFEPPPNIKGDIDDAVKNASKIEDMFKDLDDISSRSSNDIADDCNETKFSNLNNKILNLNELSDDLKNFSGEIIDISKTLQDYFENTSQYISNLLSAVFNITIGEMSVTEAHECIDDFIILDVRRRDEFDGPLGHIAKAKLLTGDAEFDNKLKLLDKNKNYLMVCRSGGRSARASTVMKINGFSNVTNMVGGMLDWNEHGLPIIKKQEKKD